MDRNDLMEGNIRIKVDMPALEADVRGAAAFVKKEIGNIKPNLNGSGPAGSLLNQEALRKQNQETFRQIKADSRKARRELQEAIGQAIPIKMRLDAKDFNRDLRKILTDKNLTQAQISLRLRQREKQYIQQFRDGAGRIPPRGPNGLGSAGGSGGSGGGRFFGSVGNSAVGRRVGSALAGGPAGLLLDASAAGATTAAAAYSAITAKIANDGVERLAMVEKYKSSLQIILKDQAKANKLFSELEQLDIRLPVGLDTLAGSAQKLAGAGFDVDKIPGMVESIADAASVSTVGLTEGVNRITRALTQIRSKGKLEMEDLNQIAELGLPIRQIIKEQFGMSSDELRDAIKDGAMTMDQALAGIFAGFNSNYAGALEAQTSNLLGLVDKLKASWSRFAGEASEPLFEAMKYSLSEIVELLNSGSLDDAFGPFTDGIDLAAGGLTVLTANLENLLAALESNTTFRTFAATMKVLGASGEDIAEIGKEVTDQKKRERQLDAQIKARQEKLAAQAEIERRAALTPEQRAAEDEANRKAAQAEKDREDFKLASDDYRVRNDANFDFGLDSEEGQKLLASYRDRQSFQPILDAANKADKTSLTYDDFTDSQRQAMRDRAAKDSRAEEIRGVKAKRARAAGLTLEEFEARERDQLGQLGGSAASAAGGLLTQGLRAGSGALGSLLNGADRITGGALSAVGKTFTASPEEQFAAATSGFERIRNEAIANAKSDEERQAIEGMKINLEGFVDPKRGLEIAYDMEAMQRQNYATQSVGFGDLNRAIQDRIDQAKQIKAAEETAKATSEMSKKFDKLLDVIIGGNRSPDLTSPLGP